MSNLRLNIKYKLKALPTDGLEDYAFWADRYLKISKNNIEILRILYQLKEMDPANDYTERINTQLRTAMLDDMEWEIESRRIFTKWLRDT